MMPASLSIRFATTPEDLSACFSLRTAVFVGEQGVTQEEEYDGLDEAARHVLAVRDGVPVATARIRQVGTLGKIERVCVSADQRGTGAGRDLMVFILEQLRADASVTGAKLGSQVQAIGFYSRLGFEPTGPEFIDAGIPHVNMIKNLQQVQPDGK